ncbi:Lrp/AsnC ligand binding domain-containing protein [Parathalassolituus penaei]|uniref:Lrp/AsnC ligand binding domain-containing protein n=1 Tax=Parathalassolituus penaei TaxID=2997323 RepID=A0A9X3ENS2_9GAMM|nr:Lrp/AsnC ligand binding domain-containing protein [Parathalassolituus penaei]MCY0966073.1 Lrp/AsnC ligand binding domain-containing protein [Parathalassolituus penaei]
MTTAIVLIKAASLQVNQVAQQLLEIDGIRQVYSVAGRYDLVALLEAANNEAVAAIVTDRIHKIDGLRDTDTMFAFASHSRKDMEAMFSVGS